MEDTDIAWFTGIFEGEGCFTIEKNGSVKLAVSMTDPDIIERIRAMFPKCQNMKSSQPKPPKGYTNTPKVCHNWRVSDPVEAERITRLMLPRLGERRAAKARGLLEHLRTRPGMGGYQRAKTHCPQGHEYLPENTIYRRGVERICRACTKVWYTRENQKRAERSKVARQADPICGRCDEPFNCGDRPGRRPSYCPDCKILQRREAFARCMAKKRARQASSARQLTLAI